MNTLEEKLLLKLSKEVSNYIHWEVLAEIYKSVGWTELSFNPHVEELLSYEISSWMKSYLTGHYTSQGTRWLFEKQKDATLFALRWGCD